MDALDESFGLHPFGPSPTVQEFIEVRLVDWTCPGRSINMRPAASISTSPNKRCAEANAASETLSALYSNDKSSADSVRDAVCDAAFGCSICSANACSYSISRAYIISAGGVADSPGKSKS